MQTHMQNTIKNKSFAAFCSPLYLYHHTLKCISLGFLHDASTQNGDLKSKIEIKSNLKQSVNKLLTTPFINWDLLWTTLRDCDTFAGRRTQTSRSIRTHKLWP